MRTNESTVVDCSDGEGLMKLGAFLYRYPGICPFCFSKYPEGEQDRIDHINRCSRIAQGIRDDALRKSRGY